MVQRKMSVAQLHTLFRFVIKFIIIIVLNSSVTSVLCYTVIVAVSVFAVCVSGLLRLVAEVPLHEDTLFWILTLGITRDVHLSTPDVIDLVDVLVKRAALLHTAGACLIFPLLYLSHCLEKLVCGMNLFRVPTGVRGSVGYGQLTVLCNIVTGFRSVLIVCSIIAVDLL